MKSLIILMLFFSLALTAQQSEKTINQPYESFSKAYKTLDATILEHNYAKKAVLLNLYENGEPNSIKGAKAITDYFNLFFEKIKSSGQTMELTFKITDREKVGDRYYDNGYYKLKMTGGQQPVYTGYGKLSTVLVWDDGKWKFQIDANTNTSEEYFENAKTNAIVQPE